MRHAVRTPRCLSIGGFMVAMMMPGLIACGQDPTTVEMPTPGKLDPVAISGHPHDHEHDHPAELTAEQKAMLESPEVKRLLADFRAAGKELAIAMGDLRAVHLRYINEIDQSPGAKKAFREQRDRVRNQLRKTLQLANQAMVFGEREAATYALTMVRHDEAASIYDEDTYEAAAKLLDSQVAYDYLVRAAIRSSVATGHFETARNLFDVLEGEAMEDVDFRLQAELDLIEEQWEAEQKRRQEDKDLPQVRFRTTNGEFLVELYPKQAPSAVAHFIGLVEDGFVEDAEFFQVIDDLLALCGHPTNSASDRFLKDEHDRPDARSPLRGSLVMAKIPHGEGEFVPNSATTQFVILMLPLPMIAESQTVFGRVIEGMDVASTFQRADPNAKDKKTKIAIPPDRIIQAEVVSRPDSLPQPEYVAQPGPLKK